MASPRYTRNIRPEDLIPDAPVKYTRWQRFCNWVHYHKWYLLAAAVLLFVVFNFLSETVWKPRPDCQVSIVTGQPLPDELLERLPEQLASLAADENGDGKVLVRVEQYTMNFGGSDTVMDAYADFAGETMLNTDLQQGSSLIFLTDDPDACLEFVQRTPGAEGEPPAAELEPDRIPWGESRGASLELGTYYRLDGVEYPSEPLMEQLVLMRRVPLSEGVPAGLPLWNALTEQP